MIFTIKTTDRKVALITGASSGFGLLTSVALAEAGYTVAGSMRDLSKKDRLMKVAAEKGVEDRIKCVQLDVTKEDEIQSAVAEVMNRFGVIDVLVNNAGYASGGFVEEVTMEEWRQQMETNFFGLIAVAKAVIPYMRERGKGTIVNMSSISGRMALPGLGPYSASKFAVEGFSESLRLEMQPYGVNVVLVEPGSFKTDIWSKGIDAIPVDEHSPYKNKMDKMLKMVRGVAKNADDPEKVARLVVKIAEAGRPSFRYPIGKGVRSSIKLREFLPRKWIEGAITRKI
ncbi:MAG TPA: SDR family oxidoreductase [Bacillales bacterium]|nr:SDR family oxidoreductase [Bacillales bacterium]